MINAVLEQESERRAMFTPDLADFFSPVRTSAGIEVTEQVALSNTAFLNAVRTPSSVLACLPKKLYVKNGENRTRIEDHPIARLIGRKANRAQVVFDFWRMFLGSLAVHGRAYAQIIRNGRGDVVELWPWASTAVTTKRKNGRYFFEVTLKSGETKNLRQDQVFYVNGFHLSGIDGLSTLDVGAECIGHASVMEKYGASWFENGGRPGSILTHPSRFSRKGDGAKNLKKRFDEQFAGVGNAHGTVVLEEGIEWTPISSKPEESQLLEGRKFEIEEQSRLHNVPPPLLHENENSTFSNITEQNMQFIVYSLGPIATNLEQSIREQLLQPHERDSHFIEFEFAALLKGTPEARVNATVASVMNGLLTINEGRALDNRNSVEGGDETLVPLNMSTLKDSQNPPDITPGPAPPKGRSACDCNHESRATDINETRVSEDRLVEIRAKTNSRIRIRDGFKPLLKDAGDRLVQAELREVRKAMKKTLAQRGENDFSRAIEKLYGDPGKLPKALRKILDPVFGLLTQQIARAALHEEKGDAMPDLTDFLEKYTENFIKRYLGGHRNRLQEVLKETEGDATEALEKLLTKWQDGEGEIRSAAEHMALNETVRLGEAAAKMVFTSLGVRKLVWVLGGGNSCPICIEMSGKVVGIEEPFMKKGDSFNYEAEPDNVLKFETNSNVGHGPIHDGCVCYVAAA